MTPSDEVAVPVTDTKEKILDAAEALLAENGYEATSLRAVTAAAGVNLAAVNYHFGSKKGLLEAVVQRVAAPVNRRRLELLEALKDSPEEPAVEDVLRAFIEPVFHHLQDSGNRGRTVFLLLTRVISDPDPRIQNMLAAAFGDLGQRFIESLAVLVPHLSPEELWWRFKSCIGVAIFHQTRSVPTRIVPAAIEPPDERLLEMTIAFVSAGMRAPATV